MDTEAEIIEAEEGATWMAIHVKEGISRGFPVLESPRLRLRKITQEDCLDLYQCMTNPLVSSNTSFEPQTLLFPARLFRYFTECYESLRDLHFAIELKQSNKVIGVCSLQHWDQFKSKARLGYLLSPACWRQGYATEAARSLIDFGFETLELERIEARCAWDNPASERVLQKCGMNYVKTVPTGSKKQGDEETSLKLFAMNRGGEIAD
ncbi:GNAT family N-acetyltransferase [Paenibacillus bouchesdurhonensis]|uniref:GNAT family N-acetyltransferase n=1 Tax=Paenibacillus bouchesdurhonensis TaxID=1870990 RepID=UPI000DA62637|nr:GNAT family N-acetyltransferase [Paenibacillus bouchesdurhonensis]